MFQTFDNVIPESDFNDEYMILKTGSGWRFVGNSVTDNENIPFWYYDLNDRSFYTSFLFNEIQKITGQKFELKTVYANGQTYGLCGDIHIDDHHEQARTFLIYMNPMWDVRWGGATVLYYDNTIYTNMPKPNSGILFKSNIPHYGSEPTRHCKELRITVAFKLMLKE
jgi:hypothetical protein